MNLDNPKTAVNLYEIRKKLELIKGGFTIPGYKGTHEDERIAILQEVMYGAQVFAKEALDILDKVTERYEPAD